MASYEFLTNVTTGKRLFLKGQVVDDLDPEIANSLPEGTVRKQGAGESKASQDDAKAGGSESKQAKGASGKD